MQCIAILIRDAIETGTVQIGSAPARRLDHFPCEVSFLSIFNIWGFIICPLVLVFTCPSTAQNTPRRNTKTCLNRSLTFSWPPMDYLLVVTWTTRKSLQWEPSMAWFSGTTRLSLLLAIPFEAIPIQRKTKLMLLNSELFIKKS